MSDNDSTTPIEYRVIERFKGYRFTNDGHVQSCWAGSGPGCYLTDKWHERKQTTIKRGYRVVCFSQNGKPTNFHVNVLIAEAFLGPRPPGMMVCHNDGKPWNNHLSNLRYDTQQGNEDDKRIHGTRPRGSKNKIAKITEDDVRRMRYLYESGRANRISLARFYRLHHSTVGDILDRKSWTHVT